MIGSIFNYFAAKKPIKEQQKLAEQQLKDAAIARGNAGRVWQDYATDQGIKNSTIDAQNALQGKSAQLRMLQENADKMAANNLKAVKDTATSGAGALAGAQNVNIQQSRELRDATLAAEQDRVRRQALLMQARSQEAEFNDKEWEMNVNQKYQQYLQDAYNKEAWGLQNKQNALNNKSQLIQGIGNSVDSLVNEAINGFNPFGGIFGKKVEDGTNQ